MSLEYVVNLLTTVLASGVRLTLPILVAALGEVYAERSGVLNLGIEGMMEFGAAIGFVTAYFYGSEYGLLAGALFGALMGLLHAILSVRLRVNQVISGLTLALLGEGLAIFTYRSFFKPGEAPRVRGYPFIEIPLLSQIPIIGPALFDQSILFYLTIVIVVIASIILFKTTIGLNIRAVGENPRAAEALGISVYGTRTACVIFGGLMAGLAGVFLSVGQMSMYYEGMVAGRGWIALAIVIFGRWSPHMVLLGSFLFGVVDAFQLRVQAEGWGIPHQFLLMLPYIFTLVVFACARKAVQPEALGLPYKKGE